LFWLEVGDNHKSRNKIEQITLQRLEVAKNLCNRTGPKLVYVQLSIGWVHEAIRWTIVDLPAEVAIVMGNSQKFGDLPTVEWGVINQART
jgi:hypothetical protein